MAAIIGIIDTITDMTYPVIVYVSGAPGSGKTTLARQLSEHLYIPNVSSDLIHGGVAFAGLENDREHTLKDVFVPLMIEMAKKRISFVVDHVLQKGASETDIIDKLRPYAAIVNIHTSCAKPIDRYIQRVKDSALPSVIERHEHLLIRAEHHKNNLDKTKNALNLDLPLMIVKTDNGYSPGLNKIIDFIRTS